MKKIISIALALCLGITILAGCSSKPTGSGWDYIKTKNKIVVGLDDTFAPMGFRDTEGKLVGFDIDLATAVGKELAIEIEFLPIDWKSKELALSSKRVDCLWNGMSATETRQKEMSLTKKYLNNRIVIVSLNEDIKVDTADDLKKYNIATQAGSAALETITANEKFADFKSKLKEYDDYDQAIMDMEAGRIDVVVIDEVLSEYKNSKRSKKFTTSNFNFGDDFYAVGCRKEDKEVATKIDEVFAKLIESGEAETISKKWFGKNIMILDDYK